MQWCLNHLYQHIFNATLLGWQNEVRKEQIKDKFSLLCKEHLIISEAYQGDRRQTQKMDLMRDSACNRNEQHSLQHFFSRHTLILNRTHKHRIIPQQTTAEVWDKYNIHSYLSQYVYMNSYRYSIYIPYIFTNIYRYVYLRLRSLLWYLLLFSAQSQLHLNHSPQYFSLTPKTHWKHRVK